MTCLRLPSRLSLPSPWMLGALVIGLVGALFAQTEPKKPEADAPVAAAFDPKGSDEPAMAIVRTLWDSMGGKKAWDAVAVLKFDALVEKDGKLVRRTSWTWERATDRFRMEMKTKRGTFVALYDRKEKRGVALENDKKIAAEDQAAALAKVREYLETDLNFLILPWRLLDPGAHVKSAPDEELAGLKSTRIEAWFDAAAAQLPGDRYTLTLDPVGHRLQALSYTVKGNPPDATPAKFAWINWVDVGDLQFCTDKEGLNVPYRISAEGVETPKAVPEGTFDGL